MFRDSGQPDQFVSNQLQGFEDAQHSSYRVLAFEVTNHFDLPQVQQLWQERSPDRVRLCHLLGEAILQVCHDDYNDDDDGCDECDAGNDGGDSDYGDHDDGDHGDNEYYET